MRCASARRKADALRVPNALQNLSPPPGETNRRDTTSPPRSMRPRTWIPSRRQRTLSASDGSAVLGSKRTRHMTQPLHGRTIALAEGRQLEELAQMLEKEGSTTVRCPLISILDAPDEARVLAWLRELIAGRFGYVVLMTGEGVRRLLGFADRVGLRADAIAAFGRTRTVTRGPKPVVALKEIGVAPYKVAAAPTTDGVIATLRAEPLRGQTVGVQLFGAPNPALEQFLVEAGATVAAVLPYVYAPAADAGRVADLIARMAPG